MQCKGRFGSDMQGTIGIERDVQREAKVRGEAQRTFRFGRERMETEAWSMKTYGKELKSELI